MNLSKIIRYLGCFGILLTISQNAYAVKKISYEDIHSFFEGDHPLLKAQALSIDIEKTKRSHLKRSFYPELSVVAGVESYSSSVLPANDSGYIGSDLTVNLYRGGIDQVKQSINEIDLKLAELTLEEKKHHLQINALRVFWTIASQIEQLKFMEDMKVSLKNLQKSLGIKIKSGVVTRTELDGLRLSLKEFEFLEQKINLDVRKDYMLFAYLLGLDVKQSTNLAIDYERLWNKPVKLYQSTKNHRAEKIQSLDLLAEKYDLESQRAASSWKPKLDFYAGYGIAPYKEREYVDSSDRLEGALGFRLSIPVSDFVTQDPYIKAYLFKSRYAAAKRDQIAKNIQLHQRQLKLSFDQGSSLFKAAQSLSDAQYALYKKRLSEYQRGLRSATDMAESLRALQRSKFEMLSLKKQLFLISVCLGFGEGVHACEDI